MNNKGIELSINFLVVIIISIVMLGLGILLIRNFFGTVEEIRTELDAQTDSELTTLLQEGQMVAIARTRKTIEPGKAGIYGLGILNIYKEKKTFEINIESPTPAGYDSQNQGINQDTSTWLLYQKTITLEPAEQGKIGIRVEPSKGITKGEYIFNVEITAEGEKYGTQKFWTIV